MLQANQLESGPSIDLTAAAPELFITPKEECIESVAEAENGDKLLRDTSDGHDVVTGDLCSGKLTDDCKQLEKDSTSDDCKKLEKDSTPEPAEKDCRELTEDLAMTNTLSKPVDIQTDSDVKFSTDVPVDGAQLTLSTEEVRANILVVGEVMSENIAEHPEVTPTNNEVGARPKLKYQYKPGELYFS